MDESKRKGGARNRRKTFASINNEYLEKNKLMLEEQYSNRLYRLMNCLIFQTAQYGKEK